MRLLFFFSDTGGGHRSAARAVHEALQRRTDGAASVTFIDILKTLPRPFPSLPALWPQMIKLRGLPWGLFYRLTDRRWIVAQGTRALWPYVAPALRAELERHPADALVSFHPLANDLLSLASATFGGLPPMVSVSQDLVDVHAATFAPHFNGYTVPTEGARRRGLQWGVDPARLHVVGVPIRAAFTALMDLPQAEARARLKLPTEGQVVVLIGGGEGVGPLVRIVRTLGRCPFEGTPPLLVVITGRNRRLRRRLQRLSSPRPLRVEGYVQEMALWMRAADLLITKAGPNTLAEAFIAGRPLILYTAIPGQESGNVRYVEGAGAALWAPAPVQVARSVRALLQAPERRQALAARARSLARPQAAGDVADLVRTLGLVKQ
ncbi:MAG: MGDG synthase family glycosyltransferase [Anaerolineae bacterium]